MIRKSMLMTVALLAALAAIPAAAGPDAPVATRATPAQVDTTAVEQVALGERFGSDDFSFEAQDVYTARSLTRTGYDEVRIPVTFINEGAEPMLYSTIGLSGVDGYPAVQLRDSAGVVHRVDTRKPSDSMAPGSNLLVVLPGMPVHWTIGFQVPSSYTNSMQLEVMVGDTVVASIDLSGEPRSPAGFAAPVDADQIDFGDTVTWSDGVDLTFRSVETVACGSAALVHSAVSTIVEVRLENSDVVDRFFPEIRHPGVVGYAIWKDGSSGRYVGATTIFPPVPDGATAQEVDELTAAGVRSIPDARASHEIVVPPGFPLNLGLVFQSPRDSRFVEVTSDPMAVWLTAPDGSSIWLDLDSPPTSDFQVDEAFQVDVACAFAQPGLFLNTADEPQAVVSLEVEEAEEETTEN